MIKDRLENSDNYKNISEGIRKGFNWLKNIDLLKIDDGRYDIEGDSIYANVQTYDTKETALFEAHKKYIDIQYMIKGEELVGVAPYTDCQITETYDENRDIEFMNCCGRCWHETLNEGDFLIFFPNDAHQPSLISGEKRRVKKVVVKVRI